MTEVSIPESRMVDLQFTYPRLPAFCNWRSVGWVTMRWCQCAKTESRLTTYKCQDCKTQHSPTWTDRHLLQASVFRKLRAISTRFTALNDKLVSWDSWIVVLGHRASGLRGVNSPQALPGHPDSFYATYVLVQVILDISASPRLLGDTYAWQ